LTNESGEHRDDSTEPRSESAENEALRKLTDFLARGIVANPDDVAVEAVQSGRTLVLELAVAEPDVGKVIGRQGKVIRALRTVVKAAATRQGTRVDIDVV
jgi:predicted RNA-binding protein YlqC (UPF0109 family)